MENGLSMMAFIAFIMLVAAGFASVIRETGGIGELVEFATVKRFYKENGHYRLQPENDFMEPIIVDECSVLGKVIGLIRLNII